MQTNSKRELVILLAVQREYEVVSRVANDNKIVGFMVKPISSPKELYMSVDVLTFGLSTRTYDVRNVKLTNSGNIRGVNGFLLSKLPIVELIDKDVAEKGLKSVLTYLLTEMLEDTDTKVNFNHGIVGIIVKYTATCKLNEYNKLENEVAQEELTKTLRFYSKNMPKQYRSLFNKIEGEVDAKGNTVIIVSRNLLEKKESEKE